MATHDALYFYMFGRDNPLDDEFDIDELAKRVLAGELVRDVARGAATTADLSKKTPENRKLWAKKRDVRGLLNESLLDEATAYGHYHDGVIDQTAYDLEPDILEAVDELLDADEEEDDEDDEDDEDGPAQPS